MDTYPQEPKPSYTTNMGYDTSNIKDFKTYDGKIIRVVYGTLRRRYDLVYRGLTTSEKNTLLDFYEEHKSEEFYWYDIETDEVKIASFLSPPSVSFVERNVFDVRISLSVYEVANG